MSVIACHLTVVHAPNDVRIYHKEAKSLAEAGHNVVLIAPAAEAIELEGVKFVPLPKPKRRFDRFLRLPPAAFRAALASGAEVVHLHDPELLFLGLALKLKGKKVIWDAHEDIPKQIMSKEWIPKVLRKPTAWMVGLLERQITRYFDAVVAATPSVAKRFVNNKTIVVHNFPKSNEINLVCPQPYRERANRVLYIGGISRARGIMELLDAMVAVNKHLPAMLDLAGAFTSTDLLRIAEAHPGWQYVNYHGWLEREKVLRLLCEAKVGVVTLHRTPNHLESYPIKMFEYMAAGLPVVASDFPLWREIIDGAKCGVLVDPEDADTIARLLVQLLSSPEEAEAMGVRGQKAVRERYNWDVEKQKLLALYKEVLAK